MKLKMGILTKKVQIFQLLESPVMGLLRREKKERKEKKY
jgi:hypothetical protein